MNDTLDTSWEASTAPTACLRQRMVQRLIRMKTLDPARLQGRPSCLIDGTGLRSGSQHCDHCLGQGPAR